MGAAVLIATLGAESQVVTLALDALLARGVPIERVVVVHTLPDREPVRGSLERLRYEFMTARHYGDRVLFDPYLLAGIRGPLADLTSTEELEAAFQSLYALFRQHKQAGSDIHLCLAGGRKTMAVFAMATAQLLFEPEDSVWHLVSAPELAESKTLHAAAPEQVTLIALPVVAWSRLRLGEESQARAFLQALTPAEREVAELLAREGLSNAALADRLGKSERTIANQLTSIYDKLGRHFNLPGAADRATLLLLLGRVS